MALPAQDRSANFRLKRHLVVPPAVITHDLELSGRILSSRGLLRAAFLAALRRRHITLVKHFLFLFGKQESFFALNANRLDIRHVRLILLDARRVTDLKE